MKYIVLVLVTLFASYGQISLKKSVKSINGLNFSLFQNTDLIIGVLLYGMCSVAWLWVLKIMPLSKAYPFIALTFVFVPLFSSLFLGEAVTLKVILGASLIVIGVCFVHLGAN